MKAMCKERIKSGINPLMSTIIWGLGVYLFYIIWGISEILFEFDFSIAKIIVCLFITVLYGWFLIYNILTEYEIEITEKEFIISSKLSKKVKVLVCEKLSDIKKITDTKENAKVTFKIKRPLQKGDTVYITFKDGKKAKCIHLKADKKFIDKLKKGI